MLTVLSRGNAIGKSVLCRRVRLPPKIRICGVVESVCEV